MKFALITLIITQVSYASCLNFLQRKVDPNREKGDAITAKTAGIAGAIMCFTPAMPIGAAMLGGSAIIGGRRMAVKSLRNDMISLIEGASFLLDNKKSTQVFEDFYKDVGPKIDLTRHAIARMIKEADEKNILCAEKNPSKYVLGQEIKVATEKSQKTLRHYFKYGYINKFLEIPLTRKHEKYLSKRKKSILKDIEESEIEGTALLAGEFLDYE